MPDTLTNKDVLDFIKSTIEDYHDEKINGNYADAEETLEVILGAVVLHGQRGEQS